MEKTLSIFIIIIIIFSVGLSSCEKENSVNPSICNASDSVNELDWLSKEINQLESDEYSLSEYAYYVSARYRGSTVFYYGNCHPAINYVAIVYNCDGEQLDYIHNLDSELTDRTILWKHEKSKCSF